MSDYLAFVYGGLPRSGGDAREDGMALANQCLDGLKDLDPKRFPPQLLILLASPAYLDREKAEQLLKGVHEAFQPTRQNIQLIGSSVGGVFFGRRVHPEGALLVCLASRLIEALVACGTDARRNGRGAIEKLLGDLGLAKSKRIDPNPLANRLVLTFLPGCRGDAPRRSEFYPAPMLHARLYKGMQSRIWMVGGVSSANDRSRTTDGWQFAGDRVLRDSVVAAGIETGVPIGVSLNDLFDKANRKVLCATELAANDRRTILKFNGRPAQEQLDTTGVVMLAKLSAEAERTVDIPLPKPGGAVQLLRQAREGDHFQVLRPGQEIAKTVQHGLEQAKLRVYVRNPVASLLFPCKAYNPRDEQEVARIEGALAEVEEDLGGGPCVGGFFDGELGVDDVGRSRLTNGGVAYAIFGDELRERTPLYKGVSALAKRGPDLLAGFGQTSSSIYDAIKHALEVVDQTGFPSAMLSLVLYNLDRETNTDKAYIIAQDAGGSRFPEIVTETKRACDQKDILVVVADEEKARFIPDSRRDEHCDQEAVRRSGIISQYILPLRRSHGLERPTFGTLQVDVGDLSHLTDADFRRTERARMLDCFAEVFGAAILSVANVIGNHIMGRLDKAFYDSQSAASPEEGLQTFFRAAGEAFGVETGLLRLVKLSERDKDSVEDKTLVLETGFGGWYEAEKEYRREILCSDMSPLGRAVNSPDPRPGDGSGTFDKRLPAEDLRYSRKPQVVNDVSGDPANDVSGDPAWRVLLESVPPDSEQFKQLEEIKSYAAVAFKAADDKILGVFGFGSTNPWFFLKFHKAALTVLASRLTFLIEHLRAKFQRDFLFKVSPELADQKLEDAGTVLRHVTDNFRDALKAEFASLYLLDADRQRYVLRAQSGWTTGDAWVGAANYGLDSRWLGVTAIDKDPLHVPDLREHYLTTEHAYPQGLHAEHMFGEPMSDAYHVEAIGLPLQEIGPETKGKFGVLTLHRKVEPGSPSGFLTIDIPLLQQGAYKVANLVGAVLRRADDLWERDEDRRRQEVYQGINSGDEDEPFAAKICREVLKAYRATEVEFYQIEERKIDETKTELAHTWIAGGRRPPGSDVSRWQKLREPSADHSALIEETWSVADGKPSYEVAARRHRMAEGQESNPAAVKLDGLVNQVCIPLLGDQKYLAALVIRWKLSPQVALSPDARHDSYHLQRLGYILGSAYLRRRFKRQATQRAVGVQTAGIYVFQHAHKLGNAIVTLYRVAQEIKAARDEHERASRIEELEARAQEKMKLIEWVIDLAELIQNPTREPRSLYELMEESRQDVDVSGYTVTLTDPEAFKRITVDANPTLVKEVFINLMDNAVKGMRKKEWKPGERPELKVYAVVSEDKETIRITFKDNGVGMSVEQIEAAERGFVPTQQESVKDRPRKGVGVLISRYLLQVQDGSLRYDRVNTAPGVGTEAIVTVPHCALPQREE